MGKNKRPRKPYRKKSDSLKFHFSKKERAWGLFNIYALLFVIVLGAYIVFFWF